MSNAAESESIALVPLDLPNLRRLGAHAPVDLGALAIPDGALPPAKVATRALTQLDLGIPPLWCVPFLVVSESRQAVLGG
jgi:ribosomal-protein-alanine N-acetyltransferase